MINLRTALSIPIIATISLLGVYLAIIQQWTLATAILQAYITFISALVLNKYLYSHFKSNPNIVKLDYPLPILQGFKYFKINMTLLEVITMVISVYFVYLYVTTKFWVSNNVIAMCFAVYAIENWLVGHIKYIFVIFTGLICYDMYFVFHSDVMMTVAKGFDLPLKILLPVDQNQKSFAMIGLGDIIIPGLLSSMCLRCDLITAFRVGKEKALKDGIKDATKVSQIIDKEMGCFYFNSTLFGYFIGMTVTYAALQYFTTAQPALVYILPT